MAARSVRAIRVGLLAVALGGGLGLWLALALGSGSRFQAVVGGVGVAVMVSGVVRRQAETLGWGIGLLGAQAGMALGAGEPPAGAVFVGPALLTVAESAFLSVELHPRLHLGARALTARAFRVTALIAVGLGISAACLLVGHAPVGASYGLSLAGAAAAVIVSATVGLLARAGRAASAESRRGHRE